jgi:hypothetical protein
VVPLTAAGEKNKGDPRVALDFGQVTLAQTDRLRRQFDQFVIGDELDGAFQAQLDRRHQAHGFVGAGSAHVGQLLALDRVDHEVVLTAVDADDHAFVQLVARG